MKPIDLSIPLGIGTPAWPTYEPLQMKYFKRLAPNGANGQLLTHSNHVGTHLDGEIHFYTPGRDIASLPLDYLMADGVVVDLSDAAGDYDVYTSKMVEDRVEVREGDILIIHTGYHHFGWDQPTADEVTYMVKHPGPDREFALWAKEKKLRWIGVDCGSADHPMNTIIRNWMTREAKQADAHFREKYGMPLDELYSDDKYQLMHLEMFNHGIVHAECMGGDIDLLLNRRATIAAFPWRLVDGESCICRIVAFVEDDLHEELMAKKERATLTRFGDISGPDNEWLHEEGRARARHAGSIGAPRRPRRPTRPAAKRKPGAGKASAKKAPAGKASAKKAPTGKALGKKAPGKKAPARKAPAGKKTGGKKR